MIIENDFTIAVSLDQAWRALTDPQLVAPCFPGARLTSYEGDTFAGEVKVRLGPISLTYKGEGTYSVRDDATHTVVIVAKGRDSRGSGSVTAEVKGTIVALGSSECKVSMITDLSITGKPAQFGRGVISDVTDSIITKFAQCLAESLTSGIAPKSIATVTGDPVGGDKQHSSSSAGEVTATMLGDNSLSLVEVLISATPKPVRAMSAVVAALLAFVWLSRRVQRNR